MSPSGSRATLALSDQVLFVVFGTGFRAVADLAVGIALARLLTQIDFGSYRQVFLIYGMVAGVVSLGLPASLSYFIPASSSTTARILTYRTIVLLALLSLLAASIVVLLRYPLARSMNNLALAPLLLVAALYPVCQVQAEVSPHLLVAVNRHRAAGGFSLAIAAIQTGAVLVPALLGASVERLVACATAAAVLNLILALAVTRMLLGAFQIRGHAPLVGEQLRYALPLAASVMAGSIYQRLDRLLVSLVYPPATLAVYSVGATELPLIPVLPYAIGRTLIPHFVQLDREGRRSEILPIWHRSIVKVNLVLLPVFALCFIFAPEIMRLVYGPGFVEASVVLRIYLLLLPLKPTSYGTVLQALGDTRTVLNGCLLAVVLNTAIGLGLIPALGWLGPAAGAVLSQAILIGYYLNRIACRLGCPLRDVWPWRRYFAALGLTTLSALVALPLWWSPLTPLISASMCLVLFLSVYGVLAWRFREIGKEERELIRRWLSLRIFRST